MKDYVEKTISALNVDKDDLCIARGFKIVDNTPDDIILLIGFNPAGDENDAQFERTNNIYLYYLGKLKGLTKNARKYINNTYYSPIYGLFEILRCPIKWDWCNLSFDKVKEHLNGCTDKDIKIIEKFYNSHKENKYTVYIGDLFYYHETSMTSFKKRIKKEKNKNVYANEMLKMHISDLKENNKSIKFIYINNGTASSYFLNGSDKTSDVIDGVPVFYGGMLSGGHAMDNASKFRLANEIKSKIDL